MVKIGRTCHMVNLQWMKAPYYLYKPLIKDTSGLRGGFATSEHRTYCAAWAYLMRDQADSSLPKFKGHPRNS